MEHVHKVLVLDLHSVQSSIQVTVKSISIVCDRWERRGCLLFCSVCPKANLMWFNIWTLTLVIVSLSHITSISGLIDPVYYDRWFSFLTTIGYRLSTAIVVIELSWQIPTAPSHPLNFSVILINHQRGIVLHIVWVEVIVWRASIISAIGLRFLLDKNKSLVKLIFTGQLTSV